MSFPFHAPAIAAAPAFAAAFAVAAAPAFAAAFAVATAPAIAAALAIAAAAAVAAQGASDPQPHADLPDEHGIVMDAEARAALDRWAALEYHLGRAGVRTVAFTIAVTAKSPLGEVEATGKYAFDGTKGTLQWDKPALRKMLAQRGWDAEHFDRLFVPDSHRKSLAGARLAAHQADSGMVLDVTGETPSRYRSFHYDDEGRLTHFVVGAAGADSDDKSVTILLAHKKVGRKYVRTGWSYRMDTPAGELHGTVEVRTKAVGKYIVYDTIDERLEVGGKVFGTHALKFTAYTINGTLTEPSAPKPKAPEPKGPEPKGPEAKGPEAKAPGAKAPEAKGPGAKGPESQPKVKVKATAKPKAPPAAADPGARPRKSRRP